MKFALVASTLVACALAVGQSPKVLFRRQSSDCPSGYKVCGDGCIELTYTCCPDASGGCDATENCQLGSNGEYGCCPKGESCSGEGGVTTTDIINTSTNFFPGTSSSFFVATSTRSSFSATTRSTTAGTTSAAGFTSTSTRSTTASTPASTPTNTAVGGVPGGNSGAGAQDNPIASWLSLVMAAAALVA